MNPIVFNFIFFKRFSILVQKYEFPVKSIRFKRVGNEIIISYNKYEVILAYQSRQTYHWN